MNKCIRGYPGLRGRPGIVAAGVEGGNVDLGPPSWGLGLLGGWEGACGGGVLMCIFCTCYIHMKRCIDVW